MKKILIAIITFLALGVGFVYIFPDQAIQAEFARQRLMAGAEVRYKEIGGERWSYLEAGQGELIVLVHGYTGSKENWLPIMRDLAKTYRVIAVDLPGWGESEPEAGQDYGPLAQAEQLSAFLKSENQPAALLVGHSMGGMITGMLALKHPQQVQHLVLMSAAGVIPAENEFAKLAKQGKSPFAAYETDAFIDFMKQYVFADMQFIPRPMLAAIVKKRALNKEFEKTVFSQMLQFTESYTLQKRLPEISQPVGLLWCDHDKIIDPSAASIFAEGLKTSQTEILQGCGHMPMMEQPKQTAAFLLKILNGGL
jgi:abhydrolase domain-containing protein 6